VACRVNVPDHLGGATGALVECSGRTSR
jgi:hypothetical protein